MDTSVQQSSADDKRLKSMIDLVLSHVVRQREAGQLLADEDIIAQHPELMPALGKELIILRDIRGMFSAAKKAGEFSAPIPILSEAELQGPIPSCCGHDAIALPRASIQIRIHGFTGLHEVSQGGQATVFKAVQESTGRMVAIKVMPGGALASSKQRARFALEAEILAKINHPNIVKILDSGRTSEGAFFIAMDFIEGMPLDEYWQKMLWTDPEGIKRLTRLFLKIIGAVGHAHSKGIVHRDLKPSNIRVDQWGEPHVLDFGLALRTRFCDDFEASPISTTGEILGSLPWASPEQITRYDNREIDNRSDLYSLGVILFQALTGEFPYVTLGSIPEVAKAITNSNPPKPSRVSKVWRGRIDATLDEIVLSALRKSPSERIQSAKSFSTALENHLEGRRSAKRHQKKSRFAWLFLLMAIIPAAVIFRGNNFALPLAGSSKYAIVELPSVTNSIGMRLVRIPAGSFLIGDSPARMRQPGDEPLRKVQITRPYFLSVTEVTREQYRTLMGLAPEESKQHALLPVDNVSWTDAVEFCKNLSKHEGNLYRLPTEVEWEYACRAGSESVYGRTGNLEDVAWYSSNSGMKLHAVAAKAPNTWGIYDMQGNVAEWCDDIFLPVVSSLPQWRVVRGGSAMDGPNNCRTIDRKGVDPRYGWPGLGFRVALDP